MMKNMIHLWVLLYSFCSIYHHHHHHHEDEDQTWSRGIRISNMISIYIYSQVKRYSSTKIKHLSLLFTDGILKYSHPVMVNTRSMNGKNIIKRSASHNLILLLLYHAISHVVGDIQDYYFH